MSRLVSLCSQKCASGRTTRVVEWLSYDNDECQSQKDNWMSEVRFARTLSHRGIGCATKGKQDTLKEMLDIIESNKQDCRNETVDKIAVRALGCTGSFFLKKG